MISRRAISFLVLTTWAVAQAPYPVPVENPPQDTDSIPTFKTSTNLVLIHVSAKMRDGRPFEELTKDDIAVFEDDQPQTVAVFEFQRLSDQVLPASPSLLPAAASPPSNRSQSSAEEQFRDRRLLVLYFDYGSMDLGRQARATDAALRFLQTRMMVSDTIAIYAYTSELHLLQDFTDDRDRLVRAVQQLKTGASDLTYRDKFQNAGDEEFRLFNAERKLNALEDLARNLGRFPETKAIIYFSNGGKGTGIENISLVRATTVAANRANVSFYTVDVRGLDASAPLGDASVASGKGADLFSGQGVGKLRLNALTQQDTMSALALDTGGKMIFNTNDLSVGAQLAQENMSSYYIVGYYGTNPAADGKFRNIRVQLKIAKAVRLEYRPGYYAPKLFKLMDGREREKQLEEAIQLENPVTDIPIASETNYFRVDYRKYFVSLSTSELGHLKCHPERLGWVR